MAILEADLPGQEDADRLAELLYRRCYTHCILDPPITLDEGAAGRDMTSILIAANTSREVWDEGWNIDQVLGDGRILARKGGAARSFLPGEYLTHRGLGTGPAAEKSVSIFLPAGSTDMQRGFYHAFGETAADFDDTEGLLRFYWNISAEGAPRLLEAVTHEFNYFQVPFQFKCGTRESHYSRRDAAVLYLHWKYYSIAALLVERVHLRVGGYLKDGVPLFARRLAPGLGFAEDSGDSFGENRCGILAAAMSATRGESMEDRLQAVRSQFACRGLSLDRPWLKPGSVDRYEFPLRTA